MTNSTFQIDGYPAGFSWKEAEANEYSEKYVVVTVDSDGGLVVKPFAAVTLCDTIAYISRRYWRLWHPLRVWLLKWRCSGTFQSPDIFEIPTGEKSENYSLVELTVLENGSLYLVWNNKHD